MAHRNLPKETVETLMETAIGIMETGKGNMKKGRYAELATITQVNLANTLDDTLSGLRKKLSPLDFVTKMNKLIEIRAPYAETGPLGDNLTLRVKAARDYKEPVAPEVDAKPNAPAGVFARVVQALTAHA